MQQTGANRPTARSTCAHAYINYTSGLLKTVNCLMNVCWIRYVETAGQPGLSYLRILQDICPFLNLAVPE